MREFIFKTDDGLDLFVGDYGDKNAALSVLCLHGLTRNHRDFEAMIEALNDKQDGKYRFIAPDMRGRGRSAYDKDAGHYTLPTYLRDVGGLIAEFKLTRFALIGTSMGGLMSMFLMKAMGDKIAGAIINDIGPQVEAAGLKRIVEYTSSVGHFETWEAARDSVRDSQGAAFPNFSDADWMRFTRNLCREENGYIRFDYDPNIAQGFRLEPPSEKETAAMWQLFESSYNTPLLLLHGRLSDILSLDTAHEMQRRHGNADYLCLSDIGHTPMLDESQSLSQIRHFLDKIA